MSKRKPYLIDAKVGDILYNFLENNKVRRIIQIVDDRLYLQDRDGDEKVIYNTGTEVLVEKVPYYLYAPVDVLDPDNLPSRPWTPREGEWVWARNKNGEWMLCRFKAREPNGLMVVTQNSKSFVLGEVVPFKGELPPGLED